METVFWLLILFVVVFFANIARQKKMIKRYQALEQKRAQDEGGAPAPTAQSPESDAKRPD